MSKALVSALVVVTAALAWPQAGGAAELVPLAPSNAFVGAPMYAASPPGDGRVFIPERSGAIRVYTGGVLLSQPFLTVPGIVTNGERGLASIAFAPDYASSGQLYAFATDGTNLNVLEYTVADPAANVAAASVRTVLSIPDLCPYHNGGQLAFGPDGYLYITVGDDDSLGLCQTDGEHAPTGSPQELDNLDGKILRIDPRVSGGNPYTVPVDNPFVDIGSDKPEIWAYGFRNPFRASFTPDGQLVAGDVGESTWEEVDLITKGGNYGWPTCEGDVLFSDLTTACNTGVLPFYTYHHDPQPSSNAIIGGFVVRDPTLSGLTGRYLYADYNSTQLRTLSLSTPGGDPQTTGLAVATARTIFSFGQDSAGCVYVMADHTIYRVASESSPSATCPITPPSGSPPTSTPVSTASVGTTKLRVDRRGRIHMKLTCVGSAACSGTLSVRSTRKLRSGHRRVYVTFVAARYSMLAAGQTRTLTLRLRRAGRKALRSRRRVAVRITSTVRGAGAMQVSRGSGSISG